MTGMPPASGLPQPLEADDDDVAWALQTAAVEWRRGAYADAIVWLRRAAESAVEVDQFERAAQINLATNRVSEQLAVGGSGDVHTSVAPELSASDADALLDAVDDEDDGIEIVVPSVAPPFKPAQPIVPRMAPPPGDLERELPRFPEEQPDTEEEDEEYTSPISVPPDIPMLVARHRELHPDSGSARPIERPSEGSRPAPARAASPQAPPPGAAGVPRVPPPPPRKLPPPPAPPRPTSLTPAARRSVVSGPARASLPSREQARPPPPPPPPLRSIPARSGGPVAEPGEPVSAESPPLTSSAKSPGLIRDSLPKPLPPDRPVLPDGAEGPREAAPVREAAPEPGPVGAPLAAEPHAGPLEVAAGAPPVSKLASVPEPASALSRPAPQPVDTAAAPLGRPAEAVAEPSARAREGRRASQPEVHRASVPSLDPATADDEQIAADALALAAAAVVAEAEALASDAERESIDRMAAGALAAPSRPSSGSSAAAAPSTPKPADPHLERSPAAKSEPAAAPESRREPSVLGVSLANVPGLEDLPEEAQLSLVRSAKLEALGPEEEVSFFAVALVVKGQVSVVAAVSGIPCARAAKGQVVFTRGTLERGVALSAIAGPDGAVVAIWDERALDEATAACPWVADDLRSVADRFQALAGASVGALGDRLDDALRASVFEKCQVRLLLAGDVLFDKDQPVNGMHIVGAGKLDVVAEGGGITGEVTPGEFVFAESVLAAGRAPAAVRAGHGGALVVHASRHETHELMVMVPPLLEILSMA